MFFNKKRNSLTEKIYSGTPLLRSPMGQKKFFRINGVAVFTRVFFFTRKCMAVFARRQSTVAVITKLPYYRGGRKAGFHCNVFQQSRFFSFILNSMFLPFKHRRI